LKFAFFLTLLLGLSILFLYPFLWTVSASLKPRDEVFDNRLIPAHWHFANYDDVWHAAPVANWFANSTYIAVLAAFAVTISSGIVAFAFAYFRFPLRNFFFACVLATMMLPGAVTMIPVYLIWNHLGFTHPGDFLGLPKTQYPLWAGNLFASPFYVFLLRQFFLGIPRELFEAAQIDGASRLRTLVGIVLPIARPAIATCVIFLALLFWNEFPLALVLIQKPELTTVPLGLASVQGKGFSPWELIAAVMLITSLPVVALFVAFQRQFIEGLLHGSLKG
jgi:multiple sugar transport system permease protein